MSQVDYHLAHRQAVVEIGEQEGANRALILQEEARPFANAQGERKMTFHEMRTMLAELASEIDERSEFAG